MNQFFYSLQQETVEKFKMADRVELVHGDICNQSDLLNSVDVIVLNNVFECFHDNKEQVRWGNSVTKIVQQWLPKFNSIRYKLQFLHSYSFVNFVTQSLHYKILQILKSCHFT